ncbi:MAG: response regulator transcription factor, partial [Bacteroidota bacterium]
MNTVKILLADDHDCFRHILQMYLDAQEGFEVVGEARDGREAVAKASELRPDVVLMDVYMPNENGIEATRTIKRMWPSTKVFILSMDPSEAYRRNAQTIADGIIAKTSMKKTLMSILTFERTQSTAAAAA